MRVYALSDLHLPGGANKPMGIFGELWEGHKERIEQAWKATVSKDSLVLVGGDISWAMRLEDAKQDLDFIGSLPGTKVILRGNHDYWWSSLSKVRAILPDSVFALQNDALVFGNAIIAGSRGWVCPGSMAFSPEDKPIYEREVIRLGLSLSKIKAEGTLIGLLHYPPFNERRRPSGFTELFTSYNAKHIVYGHLHDKACKSAFEGERDGIIYTLASADHVGFCPKLITEV